MTRTTARLARLSGALIAGSLVLAGCSGGSDVSDAVSDSTADGPAAEPSAFNNADVTFVQEMIPHHRGALTMARLAEGRAEDPRVIDLAGSIEAAQDPEIEAMTSWLEEWGEPVPEEMAGMDHGSMDGGMDMGEMSDEDMAALEEASGAEFDRSFLGMMIEHHQGAVEMAEAEITEGTYPEAVDLAGQIVESQTAEIQVMETLLRELG